MCWREFLWQQEFEQLEPHDEPEMQRLASLMAHISNMSGKSLKEGKHAKPEDFLPEKPQSPEEQLAIFKNLRPNNGS